MHLTLLGGTGLRRLALLNHQAARRLAAALADVDGVELLTPRFFNEIAVRLPAPAEPLVEVLAEKGVLGGVPVSRLAPDAGMDDVLLLAATEMTTTSDIQALVRSLIEVLV